MEKVRLNQAIAEFVRLNGLDPPAYTLEEVDAAEAAYCKRMRALKKQVGSTALLHLGKLALELIAKLAIKKPNSDDVQSDKTPEDVRTAASLQLSLLREFLREVCSQNDLTLNLSPVEELMNALHDLEIGVNNRLLVTGALTERVVNGEFSFRRRLMIQGLSAAIIQHLLLADMDRSQLSAAKRVTRVLNASGYRSAGSFRQSTALRADTVKRWHNEARKESGAAGYCLGFMYDVFMMPNTPFFQSEPRFDAQQAFDLLRRLCCTSNHSK